MDINFFRGILTAILLVAFIGLCLWAWSGKRRKHFEEAARLPFRDEENANDAASTTDRKAGEDQ